MHFGRTIVVNLAGTIMEFNHLSQHDLVLSCILEIKADHVHIVPLVLPATMFHTRACVRRSGVLPGRLSLPPPPAADVFRQFSHWGLDPLKVSSEEAEPAKASFSGWDLWRGYGRRLSCSVHLLLSAGARIRLQRQHKGKLVPLPGVD